MSLFLHSLRPASESFPTQRPRQLLKPVCLFLLIQPAVIWIWILKPGEGLAQGHTGRGTGMGIPLSLCWLPALLFCRRTGAELCLGAGKRQGREGGFAGAREEDSLEEALLVSFSTFPGGSSWKTGLATACLGPGDRRNGRSCGVLCRTSCPACSVTAVGSIQAGGLLEGRRANWRSRWRGSCKVVAYTKRGFLFLILGHETSKHLGF